MGAQVAGHNFTCAKGTNYTFNDRGTHDAWYTLVIDTVPGAGAGGGGGGPVTPTTDDGWSMETKMAVLWGVLAVLVAVAIGACWYYQRYRRSGAAQQQAGLLSYPGGDNPGPSAADPQAYRIMA